MKKRVIVIIAVIILLLILLVPLPVRVKDGGTVHYTAVLYTYTVYHITAPGEGNSYITGSVLSILGFEVYDTVYGKTIE